MTLGPVEKPVCYLLAPNVPVLYPRSRYRLVDDRPTYLPTPALAQVAVAAAPPPAIK